VKLLARALGALAAGYRVEARFPLAARCLRLVLDLSVDRGLLEIRAEYLQRLCYLLGDQGEHRAAAEVAWLAVDACVVLGDRAGIGRALVDRAIMLEHLRETQPAIDTFLSSLSYLPEDAWYSRCSVYHGLGWIHARRGELDEARKWADEATAAHRTREGQNWWRLVWLKGEIALRRGDLEAAREALRAARSGLDRAGNPFDLALVSLRLAKVSLQAGEMGEVRRIAAEMLRLLKPFEKHRIASLAVQELARAALAGELSGELIDEVFEQVQKGRPQRGAPAPAA
jgi:tetratricopeptide (TPR) repeat protein